MDKNLLAALPVILFVVLGKIIEVDSIGEVASFDK